MVLSCSQVPVRQLDCLGGAGMVSISNIIIKFTVRLDPDRA